MVDRFDPDQEDIMLLERLADGDLDLVTREAVIGRIKDDPEFRMKWARVACLHAVIDVAFAVARGEGAGTERAAPPEVVSRRTPSSPGRGRTAQAPSLRANPEALPDPRRRDPRRS